MGLNGSKFVTWRLQEAMGFGYVCQDDFQSVKLSSDHTHSGARSPERAIDRYML